MLCPLILQSNISLPSGATIIKNLPPGIISIAKPGSMPQIGGAGVGKQTIVIASPRASVAGSMPTKIITAVPRAAAAGGAGTQYIVVTTRPGGVAGTMTVPAGTAGRVIRKFSNASTLFRTVTVASNAIQCTYIFNVYAQ